VAGVIERESGCQPVDRDWPDYALTDLGDRPLGRCATVDGLFDTRSRGHARGGCSAPSHPGRWPWRSAGRPQTKAT
jgi:hypothetical protein